MNCKAQDKIDTRALRSALGQFATGVAVVTAIDHDGGPVGMTINSFSSVSLSPALVAWCIDRNAASYSAFVFAPRFALSILGARQEELALRFATRGADKFRGIDVSATVPPVIEGASAWFQCESCHSALLGDHRMMIGRVIEFGNNDRPPLVFGGGRFRRLVDAESQQQRTAA